MATTPIASHTRVTTSTESPRTTSTRGQFEGRWLELDNKLYTYAYFHDGFNGLDVGGSLPNGVVDVGDIPNGTVNLNGTPNPNNVPGQQLTNTTARWAISSAWACVARFRAG